MVELSEFKQGMRCLASGVSLITTSNGDDRYGLIATSVVSVSGEPPTLLVCVNSETTAHDPMISSGVFCVNLLGQEDKHIAAIFSDKLRRDERFVRGDWTTLKTGAPSLKSAIVSFDCEIATKLEYASHTVFFGTIKAISFGNRAIEPLVYAQGQYRMLA